MGRFPPGSFQPCSMPSAHSVSRSFCASCTNETPATNAPLQRPERDSSGPGAVLVCDASMNMRRFLEVYRRSIPSLPITKPITMLSHGSPFSTVSFNMCHRSHLPHHGVGCSSPLGMEESILANYPGLTSRLLVYKPNIRPP